MIGKISNNLGLAKINKAARETNFVEREGKISCLNFIDGLFSCFPQGSFSLRQWALNIASECDVLLSKQALGKRLSPESSSFMYELLQQALSRTVEKNIDLPYDFFNRLIVRDSTCGALPNSLNKIFPGSYSHSEGRSATMRVQYAIDLKEERAVLLNLSSYSDNDQANACKIAEHLEERDLSLDDLGYFKIDKFRQISEKGAFFLSRLKPGINIFKELKNEKLDLHAIAKELKSKKIKHYDEILYLGSEQKLKLRIVMIRVPEAIANERRRKAKKDRHAKSNHSKEYLDMLDWTILITNIPASDASPLDLLNLYKLRWRIEIIFKLWKQCLNFENLLGNKQVIKNPDYVYTIVYAFLLYVVAFVLPTCRNWRQIMWEQTQSYLSYEKFINFLQTSEGFDMIYNKGQTQNTIDIIYRYCTYERRRDRLNFFEELESIIQNLKRKFNTKNKPETCCNQDLIEITALS